MMNRLFPFIVFLATLLGFNLPAMAETKLNQLIKEQQQNDRNVLRENKIERRDVFSSMTKKTIDALQLPEESPCYLISTLAIENDFLHRQEITDIKKSVAGKCLGAQGIARIATVIQDYYINAGYITTRVDTPSQDLSTHILRLRITPGRIEDVSISNNDVSSWILPFGKGDILNIRDIEQGLENLQKVPGTNVKINIVPGEIPGFSDVVINTNRVENWSFRSAYNNWGDKNTGRQLLSAAGYLYNVAHINDLFYLAGTSSTTRGYNNFSSYYSFPFGYWEYEFFYSKSKSHQSVDIASLTFDYSGKSEYLSMKGSRTLYRDRDKKVAASAELLRRKSSYRLGDIELALQERNMGNVRLALNYKQNFAYAALDSTFRWQRFLTYFGGKKTPDMLSGDVNTQSQVYSFYTHYLKWLSLTPFKIYYDLNFGAQYSKHPLTLQDQFTVGNRWSVRGFENSSGLDGNKGYYLQNTLGILTGFNDIELYVGADYGQIVGDIYPQGMYTDNKLMGVAVGMKGLIKSLGYDFSLTKPLIYPDKFSVDKLVASFNFSYQL